LPLNRHGSRLEFVVGGATGSRIIPAKPFIVQLASHDMLVFQQEVQAQLERIHDGLASKWQQSMTFGSPLNGTSRRLLARFDPDSSGI
jgi:hypothetical protein